jgi:hypothetical protein
MKRRALISSLPTFALVAASCKLRDKVREEPTDEEAPVLLSSVSMGDPAAAVQLLRGFYDIEHGAWRWTASKFSLVLKSPAGAREAGGSLIASFTVPEAVIKHVRATKLTATVNGSISGSKEIAAPGDQNFTLDLPGSAFQEDSVTIDFALSKFAEAGSLDARELGVIIHMITVKTS